MNCHFSYLKAIYDTLFLSRLNYGILLWGSETKSIKLIKNELPHYVQDFTLTFSDGVNHYSPRNPSRQIPKIVHEFPKHFLRYKLIVTFNIKHNFDLQQYPIPYPISRPSFPISHTSLIPISVPIYHSLSHISIPRVSRLPFPITHPPFPIPHLPSPILHLYHLSPYPPSMTLPILITHSPSPSSIP